VYVLLESPFASVSRVSRGHAPISRFCDCKTRESFEKGNADWERGGGEGGGGEEDITFLLH